MFDYHRQKIDVLIPFPFTETVMRCKLAVMAFDAVLRYSCVNVKLCSQHVSSLLIQH